MEAVWPAVFSAVYEKTGIDLEGAEPYSVGGGYASESFRLKSSRTGEAVFVKLNPATKLPVFEAEFLGLEMLAATETIRIPTPLVTGSDSGIAFIAMEAITFQTSSPSAEQSRAMGQQLAQLHTTLSDSGKFGWVRDNTIGETPQQNDWCDSWTDFFVHHRLGYQFDLAHQKQDRIFRNAEALLAKVPGILADHKPAPSLLHGDLWGGNAGFDDSGNPVIFDPATYFGDLETDLAFTEMFGGFAPEFYEGYAEVSPPSEGSEIRKTLYNLYHVLNHHNLFGGGYGAQAESMISKLLRF